MHVLQFHLLLWSYLPMSDLKIDLGTRDSFPLRLTSKTHFVASLTQELSKVKSTFNDRLTCRYTYCVPVSVCTCVRLSVCVCSSMKNTTAGLLLHLPSFFAPRFFYPMMAKPSWLWPVGPSAARPRCGQAVPSAAPFNLISCIRPCSWTGTCSSCNLWLTPVSPSLWVCVICLFCVCSCSSTPTKWHQITATYCLQNYDRQFFPTSNNGDTQNP